MAAKQLKLSTYCARLSQALSVARIAIWQASARVAVPWTMKTECAQMRVSAFLELYLHVEGSDFTLR